MDIRLPSYQGAVIKKDGICYEFVGFEAGTPTHEVVDGQYADCALCEAASPIEGGSSSGGAEQGESSAVQEESRIPLPPVFEYEEVPLSVAPTVIEYEEVPLSGVPSVIEYEPVTI